MKTLKITLSLGLIILIAAGLLFPLPQWFWLRKKPQPESTHKVYLPIISKYRNLRRPSNLIRLARGGTLLR